MCLGTLPADQDAFRNICCCGKCILSGLRCLLVTAYNGITHQMAKGKYFLYGCIMHLLLVSQSYVNHRIVLVGNTTAIYHPPKEQKRCEKERSPLDCSRKDFFHPYPVHSVSVGCGLTVIAFLLYLHRSVWLESCCGFYPSRKV